MANFNLRINSKYDPLSYEEMIKPLQDITNLQIALEAAYDDLLTKASVWENMANSETDPASHAVYQAYVNDLERQAEELATLGLTPRSSRDLSNMKVRFAREMTPLEVGYLARAKDIERQLTGMINGIMYETEAANTSLDNYARNPNLVHRLVNTKEGYQRMTDVGKALADILNDYGTGRPVDAYTNTFLTLYGVAPEDVSSAIDSIARYISGEEVPEGLALLVNILQGELNASGVDLWNPLKQLEYINRVAPALYNAVGKANVSTFDNAAARAALTNRERRSSESGPTITEIAINPRNIYTNRQLTHIDELILNRNKYSKYVTIDDNGVVSLTPLGDEVLSLTNSLAEARDTYRFIGNTDDPMYLTSSRSSNELTGPSGMSFRTMVRDLLGESEDFDVSGTSSNTVLNAATGLIDPDYQSRTRTHTRERVINALLQLYSADPNRYDATKHTEYSFDIDSSQLRAFAQKIRTALGDNDALEATYNDNLELVDTSNKISRADIGSDNGYMPVRIEASGNGLSVTLESPDKGVKRIRLVGVNQTDERSALAAARNAEFIRDTLQNGKIENGGRRLLTPQEKQYYEQQYRQWQQNIYTYVAQLLLTNKANTQSFDAYPH